MATTLERGVGYLKSRLLEPIGRDQLGIEAKRNLLIPKLEQWSYDRSNLKRIAEVRERPADPAKGKGDPERPLRRLRRAHSAAHGREEVGFRRLMAKTSV